MPYEIFHSIASVEGQPCQGSPVAVGAAALDPHFAAGEKLAQRVDMRLVKGRPSSFRTRASSPISAAIPRAAGTTGPLCPCRRQGERQLRALMPCAGTWHPFRRPHGCRSACGDGSHRDARNEHGGERGDACDRNAHRCRIHRTLTSSCAIIVWQHRRPCAAPTGCPRRNRRGHPQHRACQFRSHARPDRAGRLTGCRKQGDQLDCPRNDRGRNRSRFSRGTSCRAVWSSGDRRELRA